LEELKLTGKKIDWPSEPVSVTDSDFQDFIKKYPCVIVDCWATWCKPCCDLIPVIDGMAKTFQGKVVFGKLNIDDNQNVPAKFGIQSIPTLLFFKNGEFVEKQVGAPPKPVLEEKIRNFIK
jgi:thioredoxin 1